MGFMIAQRAFIKVHLITLIEKRQGYGYRMLERMKEDFAELGYVPPMSEIYRALHDLVQEGMLFRTKHLKGNDPTTDFQEIIIYQFTDGGYEKAALYKKQVKVDLDRCIALLQKAVRDNY